MIALQVQYLSMVVFRIIVYRWRSDSTRHTTRPCPYTSHDTTPCRVGDLDIIGYHRIISRILYAT